MFGALGGGDNGYGSELLGVTFNKSVTFPFGLMLVCLENMSLCSEYTYTPCMDTHTHVRKCPRSNNRVHKQCAM